METIQDFKKFSFSTQFAVVSFVLGTLLFASYYIFPNKDGIIILGLFYTLFAVFFNIMILINLVFQWLIMPIERENIAVKILIVLANIPVALIYFFVITKQINLLSNF